MIGDCPTSVKAAVSVLVGCGIVVICVLTVSDGVAGWIGWLFHAVAQALIWVTHVL